MRATLPLTVCALALLLVAGRETTSLYDFEVNRIDGEATRLEAYRGQVLLIVNVASKCGYTPQYEGLESLYENYRERGFAVLGFPSNDFGGQEPGTNEQIATYCKATWGVQFPMFEKLEVRGEGKHPLYQFLTSRPAPVGGEIEWNFQKFLVDRSGQVVERLAPGTPPDDPALLARIEALIASKPD